MTDKNKERRELTVEDLKGISGGLIIDGGANYDSAVVDDTTGDVLIRAFANRAVLHEANKLGVSTEMITPEEYEARFGKKWEWA